MQVLVWLQFSNLAKFNFNFFSNELGLLTDASTAKAHLSKY